MAEDETRKTTSGGARRGQSTRAKAASSGKAAAKSNEAAAGAAKDAETSGFATVKGLMGGRPLPAGVLAVLAVIVALALVFLVWPAARQQITALFSPSAAEVETPAVAQRLDMFESRLTRIEDALATIRAAPTPDLGPLEARLAALESRMDQAAEAGNSLRGVEGRLEMLEGRVASLARRIEAASSGTAARGTLALLALTNALRQGTSFAPFAAPARAALAASRGGDAGDEGLAARLEALASYAESGVPDESLLLARFAGLPRSGEAPPAARAEGPPAGLWDRIRARIQGLVVIRRVDEGAPPSEEPPADEGAAAADLAAALAAIEGVSGPEAEAWRRDARARIEADRLADELDRVIAARLDRGS